MKDELHRHLDGDVPFESLEGEVREKADEWARMLATFRASAPRDAAPPWLEQKVMSEIEALSEPGVLGRLFAWLIEPAAIRVPPLAAGLVAAALALVILLPGRAPDPIAVAGPQGSPGVESITYVQFVLDAPNARTVAVAGDFSDWEPSFRLEDIDGDGIWTGRVPVRPGVHGYMFLIDGTEWQTDPYADRYQDDGFGNRNAILAVAAGA